MFCRVSDLVIFSSILKTLIFDSGVNYWQEKLDAYNHSEVKGLTQSYIYPFFSQIRLSQVNISLSCYFTQLKLGHQTLLSFRFC